ncbi:serine hydrolase [Pseudomonas sp. M30-35]|uniref:serine hydrolase domain-containing protein n=1 Tax=Pseudomonas sp. M30-35 TaxID=1981174 RepID=UPI000B3CCF19|nr:serine hydrolase [Pseudomonas sp. M30-35]ARU86734.1 6-aminohexanoate hydrolase [Pseudomonas sp. M30-35]
MSFKRNSLLLALIGALLVNQNVSAATGAAPLDAKASEPQLLGLMQGTPPAAEKVVNFSNFLQFPFTRWSFSHIREVVPTVQVPRGSGAVSALPRAERDDIDGLSFKPMGSDNVMTWKQSLAANYTDGIVVLHRGKLVYERYLGALKPEGQHIAFSVTKSFIGTLAAMLVADGTLDENALVSRYVPELKDSAFGNATVRQVMDMTTSIDYSEDYADPKAGVWEYSRAGHLIPRPAGYTGATSLYGFLQKLKADGEHGQEFAYKTVNSDALAWVVQRVTGKPFAELLQERIWSKLGAEQDAYIMVDEVGTGFAGGGFNASLRDMARFGEAMRLNGRFNGQQIIPEAVVADIRKGGDQNQFAKAGYKTLPGWSYRNMWWVTNNDHQAFTARGIYGQTIYVDPKAEMVIARFASYPVAMNAQIDPTSLPAYSALADFLMAKDK